MKTKRRIIRQLERIKSEFSLKLDFYKVVYPEKVKAALDLHNLAAKLFITHTPLFCWCAKLTTSYRA